jgi:hypothetical protein
MTILTHEIFQPKGLKRIWITLAFESMFVGFIGNFTDLTNFRSYPISYCIAIVIGGAALLEMYVIIKNNIENRINRLIELKSE